MRDDIIVGLRSFFFFLLVLSCGKRLNDGILNEPKVISLTLLCMVEFDLVCCRLFSSFWDT